MHLMANQRTEFGPRVAGTPAGSLAGSVPAQPGMLRRLLDAAIAVAGGVSSRPEKKRMRVLETLALGPKKQLVLVSCDGERFLVGTGPESVQTILRVGPAAVVNALGRERP